MINDNNIILNNDLTYNVYYLNRAWEFETINYFDFFLDLINPFVIFFFVINLGFVGFLISVFSTKKFFNTFFCQFLLILIFFFQFFYFKFFINFVTSLNFHPFGIQLNLVNNYFIPFLTEFKYGVFLNVLNYSFVQIVIFLTFICFILVLSEKKIVFLNFNDTQKAIKNIFLINLFSINVFLTDNLIYFFFFLECSVFPMVFLIGYFGPRLEKTKAATLYFYVSLISGFFIFFGLSILSFQFENLTLPNLMQNFLILNNSNTNFLNLISFFNNKESLIAFFCLFIGLALKLPIFPFHIQLPEAHGEASTIGSILLAGIYLKMSAYGFLFIIVPFFNPILNYFQNFLMIFFFLSIILSSIILFKIVDLKKFIAYTSIIHMNFTILLIFTKKTESLFASLYSLVTHSYITSALFFLVGAIYQRTHTRNVLNFKLVSFFENATKLCLIFFFFLAINASVPIGPTFLAEIEIIKNFSSLNFLNYLLILLIFIGLSSLAHFFLINKIIGNIDIIFSAINHYKNKNFYFDISKIEFLIILTFFFFVYKLIFDLLFFLGPNSEFYLNSLSIVSNNVTLNYENFSKDTFLFANNLIIDLNNSNNIELTNQITFKLEQDLNLKELIILNKKLNLIYYFNLNNLNLDSLKLILTDDFACEKLYNKLI